MAKGSSKSAAFFFGAALLIWAFFVAFEVAFNKRKELLVVAIGFAFFQLANCAAHAFASKDPLFVNTCVSLLHSTISSASVAFVLINQWIAKGLSRMLEHEELFGGKWTAAYSALCFSCGYFAYDQLDMLRYRLYSGPVPAILLHHLILLICFTLALHRNVTVNYLILSLACEMHSIFLHLRKVRRKAGIRDAKSRIVMAEWMLSWLAFFVSRLACHILITYKLLADRQKFGRGVELPLALLGMTGMNILNVSLGLDLFRAFKLERNNNHES